MNPLKITFLSLVLVGTFSSNLYAQFTLSAQLRPRMELRKGYRIPQSESSKAAFFVSQRTRLKFGYQHEILEIFVSLQDVRTWGDQLQLTDVASFSMHQAWLKLKMAKGLFIRVGRQEFVYDEHRLLGNVNWVQQARSHDAILLIFKKGKWKLDAAGAFNQLSENVFSTEYVTNNYKALIFARGEKKIGENATLVVTGIADAFERDTVDRELFWRYTYGSYFKFNKKGVSLVLSAYGQQGETRGGAALYAFMANARIGYAIKKMALNVGVDFVSGDNPNDAKYQAFNTLYATNHKFYGFMDYYLSIPNDTKGGGLQDYFFNLNYMPTDKIALKLYYHQFLLANTVYKTAFNEVKKNLGSEVDFVLVYNIKPYIGLQVGGSAYIPTNTTEYIKGGSQNKISGWGWVMLNATPQLFKSKTKKEKEEIL